MNVQIDYSSMLQDLSHAKASGPPARIIRVAAELAGCTVEAITGPIRTQKLAWPRQAAMYVMRKNGRKAGGAGRSYELIGRRFGNRNHATVIHAIRCVEADMKAGRTYKGSRPWMVARILERAQQ